MSQMTIEKFRQLREALEWYDNLTVFEPSDKAKAILAAARQTLDRWQECESCGGLGEDWNDEEYGNGDYQRVICPSCGGRGVLPKGFDIYWCNDKKIGTAESQNCYTPAQAPEMHNGCGWVRAFDKETDHE